MLNLFRKSIQLFIFVFILSSCLSVNAGDKISKQHQNALEALQAEDWDVLKKLSSKALSSIDKELENDWEYDGDLRIMDNQFLGDKLILVTQKYKDGKITMWVEIRDPHSGKLEKKFKYKDCRFVDWWAPTGTGDGIVFLNIKDAEGDGKKLIVLNENRITKPIELEFECDEVNVLQQHEDKLFFSVIRGNPKIHSLNLTSGKHAEVSTTDSLELSDCDFFKIDGDIVFLDGDNLYNFKTNSNSFQRNYNLPFVYSGKDKFFSPYLYSIRADTLFKTDLSSGKLSFKTTHMPFVVKIEDSQNPEIYGNGNWFGQVRTDSLYIVDISARDGVIEGLYPFAGWVLSVNGEYLINTGEYGMRIFHKGTQKYSVLGKTIERSRREPDWGSAISGNGFGEKTPPKAAMEAVFFYHQQPADLVAFDLRNNEIIWTKNYFILETEGQVFNIGDKFIYVNCAEGSKYLLDASTGKLLSFDQNRWGLKPHHFNSDHSLFTRWSNWEVQYFRVCNLSQDRYLRGDLAGMCAIGAFNTGDSKKAINFGKTALTSGKIQSEDVLEGLYSTYVELGQTEAADQIAGRSYIETGKDLWKNRLAKHGLIFTTDLFMDDSYSYYITGDHLTAFTNWGHEEYAYRNREIDFYSLPLNGDDISLERKHLQSAYHIRTSEGPIIFNYSTDENSKKVSWTPLLLSNNGEQKKLSPLPDTYFADEFIPNRRSVIHWWIPSGTSPGKDGYLLGDFLSWGMDGDNTEYTFGVDVRNGGPSWVDETLYEPVKAGEHFYSHSTYGNMITRIVEGSQADSLKLRPGDVVIGMGDHWININLNINDIKKLYEPGELVNFFVMRDSDTLTYQIHNGKIGYHQNSAKAIVEVDPSTGNHLASHPIDPEYHYACRTTEGYLVYQNEDKLMLWNPAKNIKKVSEVKGLDEFYMGPSKSRLKTFWTPLETDKIILYGPKGRFIGLDLTFDTPDKKRILWDKVIDNLHDCPFTDDPFVIPFIMKNNEILYIEQETGDIVFKETLPFETSWHAIVEDGVMYLSVDGRIVGWQLKYYQQ